MSAGICSASVQSMRSSPQLPKRGLSTNGNVRDVESSEPSERLPSGPRGTPATRSAPAQLELYGTRRGFQWRYGTRQGTGTAFELRVDTVGGDHIRIDHRVVGITAIVIGWPAFANGRVYWSRGCFGDPSGCAGRVAELRRGTYVVPLSFERAPGPRIVLAHEHDSGVTWALTDPLASTALQWCAPTSAGSIEPLRPSYTPAG
jgi:hypothetical protein